MAKGKNTAASLIREIRAKKRESMQESLVAWWEACNCKQRCPHGDQCCGGHAWYPDHHWYPCEICNP